VEKCKALQVGLRDTPADDLIATLLKVGRCNLKPAHPMLKPPADFSAFKTKIRGDCFQMLL
jgi:hypothetical protein